MFIFRPHGQQSLITDAPDAAHHIASLHSTLLQVVLPADTLLPHFLFCVLIHD